MSGIWIKWLKDDIRNLFSNELRTLPNRFTELIDALGEISREGMVAEAPFKWGDLREGHVVLTISQFIRYVFSDVPHFPWVVEGTQPHIIEGNPWLYWPGAEHPVRRVNHPGTSPNDYPARAAVNVESSVDARVNEFLEQIGRS